MAIKRKDGSTYVSGVNSPPTIKNIAPAPIPYTSHVTIEEIPSKTLAPEKPKEEKKQDAGVQLVELNCLPTEMIRDNVYDEDRMIYKPAITIDAFIASETDLSLRLWSETKLEQKTIIQTERRWWNIISSREEQGWTEYSCITSSVTPFFVAQR